MDLQVQHRVKEMCASMSELGVNVTPRRAKVLETLASTDCHPTVNEIHSEVRRIYPSTSLATIYNTIELLKEAGQVLELEFSGSPNRYDGLRPESHPHLICLSCRSVEDMDAFEIEDVSLERVSGATGYNLVRQRTDYYGICPVCQESDGGPSSSAKHN